MENYDKKKTLEFFFLKKNVYGLVLLFERFLLRGLFFCFLFCLVFLVWLGVFVAQSGPKFWIPLPHPLEHWRYKK